MSHKYNIYLRKDGRYEGRVPIGRAANGKLCYKYRHHRDEKKLSS